MISGFNHLYIAAKLPDTNIFGLRKSEPFLFKAKMVSQNLQNFVTLKVGLKDPCLGPIHLLHTENDFEKCNLQFQIIQSILFTSSNSSSSNSSPPGQVILPSILITRSRSTQSENIPSPKQKKFTKPFPFL